MSGTAGRNSYPTSDRTKLEPSEGKPSLLDQFLINYERICKEMSQLTKKINIPDVNKDAQKKNQENMERMMGLLTQIQKKRDKFDQQIEQTQNSLRSEYEGQFQKYKSQVENRLKAKHDNDLQIWKTKYASLEDEVNRLRDVENTKSLGNVNSLTNEMLEQLNKDYKETLNRLQKNNQELTLKIKQNQEEHKKSIDEHKQQINKLRTLQARRKTEEDKIKTVQPSKGIILKSMICLQAMKKLNTLPNELQPRDLKEFINFISIDESHPQAFLELYSSDDLSNRFESVVKGIASKYNLLQSEKLNQIKQHEETLNCMKNQIQQLQTQKSTETTEKIKYMQNSEASDKKNKELYQQLSTQKMIVDRKEEEIGDKSVVIKRLQEELSERKREEQNFKNQISTLTEKLNQAQTESKRQNEQITKKKIIITEKERTVTQLTKEKQDLQNQLSSLKEKKRQLETDLNQTATSYEKLKKDYSKLQIAYEQKKQKIQSYEKQLKRITKQLQEQRKASRMSTFKIEKQEEQYRVVVGQRNKYRAQLEDAQSQMRQLRTYQEAYWLINKDLINQLSYYIGKNKIDIEIDDTKKSIGKALTWFKNSYDQARYFGGSDFIDRPKVPFLINEIRSFTGSYVVDAKMIFKFDQKNPTSFHHYIDGKENLLFVVRLSNGRTIGGFSSYALAKLDKAKAEQQGYGKGILFSLTHERVCHIKKQTASKVLTYDEYFFIFGNSEIRLKSQEKKSFSNYGISTSTFDSTGFPRMDFFGTPSTESETPIEGYEFWQVILK